MTQTIRRYKSLVNRGEGLIEKDEIFEEYFNKHGVFYPIRKNFFDNKNWYDQVGLNLTDFDKQYKLIERGDFIQLGNIDANASYYYKIYANEWEQVLSNTIQDRIDFEQQFTKILSDLDNEINSYKMFLNISIK